MTLLKLFPYSKILLTSAVTYCLSQAGLDAIIVTYSGDATPDSTYTEPGNPATNADLFTTVLFSGTNWVADNGFLKMTTAPVAGIWFGAHPSIGSDPAVFYPGSTLSGNKMIATSLLTSGSKSWNFQFTDSDGYSGLFLFDYTDNGENKPGVWIQTENDTIQVSDEFFNINVLHTYEVHVYNGIVAYSIDDEEVYRGVAPTYIISASYFIGDTSGSTPTGAGSMWLSNMTFDNAAGELTPVPEVSQFALTLAIASVFLVISRRNSKTRNGI